MTIKDIAERAADKMNFVKIEYYIEFAERYLDFKDNGVQATIISQNEINYFFYQYKEDGFYNVTRPINTSLIYDTTTAQDRHKTFCETLQRLRDPSCNPIGDRENLLRVIYTLQQSIGAALDGLPSGQSNKARKVNGDLFERLIQLIFQRLNIDCVSGTIQVPVKIAGDVAFRMNDQHDLLIKKDGDLKVIGSVKTSSKDRIDKIFMDKFLYSKLTETSLPHIAIFLNDVQRKATSSPQKYGISSTFLPGHFKGFTIKLNPLDGVYYCDIRPNMKTDLILKDYIKTIDHLFFDDIWPFFENAKDEVEVEVKAEDPASEGN
ncbi:hypothetical protein [Novosphingobium sp. 17-62-19]|uniref:hypothetical protein n=1 Tax=Novosphingobium sp. 17-62-19 TaxID=1970406 RepID=UPI0025F6DE17|nr:hypothetical protein [Novosphingobium sp. 17-62-19]